MKNRTFSATSSPLSHRLTDWRAFAAAAGATLAATSAADASIIYENTNMPNAVLAKTANGRTVPGASAHAAFTVDGVHLSLGMVNRNGGNSFYVKANSYNLLGGPGSGPLDRFQRGQAVSDKPHFFTTSSGRITSYKNRAYKGKFTHFSANHTGFAGFQLPASKGGGYGWLHFDFKTNPSHPGYLGNLGVVDLAYNDGANPNDLGISAGQGIPSAVPEPGEKGLALLALGSAGVLAWRRRRNAAAN